MNNKPIIVLLEENELNIGSLYSLYAQKIPEKQLFWDRLSNAEIAHASHIGNSKSGITKAEEIIENKFTRGVMRYVMDYVLQEIKRATTSDITHSYALQTALRIEQSLLEKKCFEFFKPANLTVQEVFRKLNDDTEQHVRLLLDEMKKNKFNFTEI
jgi:hypothetical protein